MGRKRAGGDIREIRLEQVGQESGKGFSMEGIDLTFGLGRKYAIVGGKREIRHRQAAHPIWAGRHRPYPGQRAGAFGAHRYYKGLMQKYNHSKTMSVLTGSIAHEFNNLMTPIVLYADLLEENDIVSAEMPEEIAELRSSAGRCEELARQLLSYSRQGKAEKVYTDYDASFAIQEAANIVKKLLPKEIRLKENISRTPYYVHGQLGALNQILLNLTTNALHARQNGGTLRIQVGLRTDDGHCVR